MSFPSFALSPTALERALLPESPEPPSAVEQPPARVPLLREDPPSPQPGDLWVNSQQRRLIYKTPDGVWSTPLELGDKPRPLYSHFAIDFYVSFVLLLALAFGVAFETPIVVFFLAWTGIVTTLAMRRARRYVLLVIVIAAAVLTPPDVISQTLLAGPMYLLFELGLWVADAVERRRKAHASM
jgi:hypothetical protein